MNKRSQKPFENSWAVTYRKPNYDALGDPHASYYFLGRSMKKHLLHLRKVQQTILSQLIARENMFKKRKLIA